MATDSHTRKLAAILSADVVGYSRLMGADESGTLTRLKAHRNEFIHPKITEHHGRIVKLMGDGALVEFASVVDALACAVDIQRGMLERNQDEPAERRIEFRMGINLGDVIIEGDDIYGDGVNVAARLETLAEPGGICISDSVHTAVGNKLPLEYEFLGEQQVKNIAKPVKAYHARLEPGAELPKAPSVTVKPERSKRTAAAVGAAVAIVVIVAGALSWWQLRQPRVEAALVERMAFPLPEKPSVAVLPFDNLTGDPEQDAIIDGLTDNLIAALSGVPKLFVVARNSTFTYKGKAVKVREVAEELGVRYVLEGSVQRSGDKLRVTVQLIDALSGRHIWAERYDRTFDDLFAMQDDIALNVIQAMEIKLTEGEWASVWHTGDHLEAYLLDLRANEAYDRSTKEDNLRARRLWEEAMALEPSSGVGIAFTYFAEAVMYSDSTEESLKLLAKAEELGKKAAERRPNLAVPHHLLSQIALARREYDAVAEHCETALELPQKSVDTLASCAEMFSAVGQAQRALELIQQAMRINPLHPGYYLYPLGLAHWLTGSRDMAIDAWQSLLERKPQWSLPTNALLAVVFVESGRVDEARNAAAAILKLSPDISAKGLADHLYVGGRFKDSLRQRMEIALVEAGIPEDPPLSLPDKPSIAVLPFTNMSDDSEQEYFADGMTDDLITDLSKISGLFVIARHSSFAYKGKSPDASQVSRELGVKYVLEGSVRRAGDDIRVNAQLIDATTGGHLWAERFDRRYVDIFALQDEIVGRIVSAFTLQLTPAEQNQIGRKPTDNLEAYEHYLRAEQGFHSDRLAGLSIAMREYETAVALDPNFAEAYAGHARAAVEYLRIVEPIVIPANKAHELAYESVSRALALDPDLSRAHSVLSMLHTFNGEHEEAVESATRAVSLNPNSAEAYSNLALVLMYAGQIPEAVQALETALRLSPNPSIRLLRVEGQVLFMSRQYERALDALTRVQESQGRTTAPTRGSWITAEAPLFRAMAYAQLDRLDEARKVLDDRFRRTEWINVEYLKHLWSDYKRPEDLEHLLSALRRAGLSELPPGYELITGDRLEGAEIADLLFGYVWVGRSQNNYETFTQSTSTGGEVVYRQFGRTWPGRVFVKNNTLCYQIPGLLLGRRFCGYVYRNPEGTPENKNEYIAVDVFDVHHFSPRS
ncbi:MAG: tetratricopeptide repeat protein [Gammaproteobacteria bacterium]|nr:tetratricopeptide repeat protein [Gammaproteobacteria bacterium]